jgi:hypothetical protein
MGVLTKYDQIEPIYLPQSVVTYIDLYPAYFKYILLYYVPCDMKGRQREVYLCSRLLMQLTLKKHESVS